MLLLHRQRKGLPWAEPHKIDDALGIAPVTLEGPIEQMFKWLCSADGKDGCASVPTITRATTQPEHELSRMDFHHDGIIHLSRTGPAAREVLKPLRGFP